MGRKFAADEKNMEWAFERVCGKDCMELWLLKLGWTTTFMTILRTEQTLFLSRGLMADAAEEIGGPGF
jgi:hypothetical protein